jgi:hypothetical protein
MIALLSKQVKSLYTICTNGYNAGTDRNRAVVYRAGEIDDEKLR